MSARSLSLEASEESVESSAAMAVEAASLMRVRALALWRPDR